MVASDRKTQQGKEKVLSEVIRTSMGKLAFNVVYEWLKFCSQAFLDLSSPRLISFSGLDAGQLEVYIIRVFNPGLESICSQVVLVLSPFALAG